MSDQGWREIGHTEDGGVVSMSFTIAPQAMIPVPVSWWRRVWLRLRRKPLPTRAPDGTLPMVFDTGDGRRIYIPAARIENVEEQP